MIECRKELGNAIHQEDASDDYSSGFISEASKSWRGEGNKS